VLSVTVVTLRDRGHAKAGLDTSWKRGNLMDARTPKKGPRQGRQQWRLQAEGWE
jgi:hypothetical protein